MPCMLNKGGSLASKTRLFFGLIEGKDRHGRPNRGWTEDIEGTCQRFRLHTLADWRIIDWNRAKFVRSLHGRWTVIMMIMMIGLYA